MKTISLPAIMLPPTIKTDGSLTLKLSTREVTSQEIKELVEYKGQEGWLLFQSNPIQVADIPKGNAETKQKTPSQRLRSVIFVEWKQIGSRLDFDAYYKNRMESFIDSIKENLTGESYAV